MNMLWIPSIVSSPIFIARLLMPLRFGIFSVPPAWCVRFIIRINSGFSTSSNGWSHAITHSVRSCSNFSWSQGPCQTLDQTQVINGWISRTWLRACWSSNTFLMFPEVFSNFLRYSASVVASSFFLPEAIATSSSVGGSSRSLSMQ